MKRGDAKRRRSEETQFKKPSAPPRLRVESFSAVLLAGGKSSRMGRDKAFVKMDGVSLWRQQMETLRTLAPAEIFISGPAREEWSGFPVVADETPDTGPLAGIVASLRRCVCAHLVVLAVDLPRMTPNFFRALLGLCTADCGAVAKSGNYYEPMAAIYPKTCLALAETCLAAGERSLQIFVARAVAAGLLHEHPLDTREARLFLNINTPADLPLAQ